MDDFETDPDYHKGLPPFRQWDLTENATRYDKFVAAPSDEDMVAYWTAWSVLSLAVGTFSLTVFCGILSSAKARRNAFNQYLLYLMIPDFVFSLACGITCLLNAINGEYWSHWMCNFQQWYCVWGIGSNTWLNMLVAHQIYTMLVYSQQRRRYQNPTTKSVTLQAVAVYLYCGFLGTWGFVEKPAFPFHSGAFSGLACLPMERDRESSLFFWLCFVPLFAGIPFGYIGYICLQIQCRQLMPPPGKRRALTVYFGRLIAVFIVMWVPTVIVLWFPGPWLTPAGHFGGGTWSHLQGAVSAGFSLMKPDVWAAVQKFLCCRCWKNASADGLESGQMIGARSSEGDSSGMFSFDIRRSFMRTSFRNASSFFLLGNSSADRRTAKDTTNEESKEQILVRAPFDDDIDIELDAIIAEGENEDESARENPTSLKDNTTVGEDECLEGSTRIETVSNDDESHNLEEAIDDLEANV